MSIEGQTSRMAMWWKNEKILHSELNAFLLNIPTN